MSQTSDLEGAVEGHLKFPLPEQIVGQYIEKLKEKVQQESDPNSKSAVLNGSGGNLCEDVDGLALNDSCDMRALYRLATSLGFSHADSPSSQEWYYGVYIPHDVRLQCGEDPVHVYTDKTEALKVMKQSKKARFNQFPTWKQAAEFAQNGSEIIVSTTSSQQTAGGEKPVSFKGPKPQDMIQFRKAIESGDLAAVRAAIEENPRYLFSSGDTPSILQEGCRYNALHVAAKSNQAAIAEFILMSVTSLPLLSRLYDDADTEALQARSNVLLDLYLNTPDKSCNETPLHFAVKYGSVQVVELLTSYPQCQRGLVNKYGATVRDLVCTRIQDERGAKKAAILDLLEERFFLPVLRYEDNSMQPRVGEPFSPVKPLDIPTDRLSPRIEVQAYAGPMSRSQVTEFRRKWRTPPAVMRTSSLSLQDPEKGLERIGRNVARELKVPWKEYWSFLDTFVDLSSAEGLALLEKHLRRRFDETYHEVMSPVEEGVEADAGATSEAKHSEVVLSPISDLCQVFQACSLNDSPRSPSRETPKKWKSSKSNDRKWRKERESAFSLKSEDLASSEHATNGSHQFSSILCVERSCQVFGKRIFNVMLCVCSTADASSLANETLRSSLEPEVKHLHTLVTGYLDDLRFNTVDFSVVHTRVAAVAASCARPLVTSSELALLVACLREIALADGTVSDDEDILFSSRRDDHSSIGAVLKTHLLCLTECLLTEMLALGTGKMVDGMKSGSAQNEADCQTLWAQALPCACAWDASTHLARARANWRRKQKLQPKLLHFANEEEGSSVEESWRSCEDPHYSPQEAEEEFETPPSSPASPVTPEEEDLLEDPISLPDTFIYPGDRPTKTDLAVLDAISGCDVTALSHPAVYRWRHLVRLHQDKAVASGQVAPSPGAWHRRRLIPSTPTTRGKEAGSIGAMRAPWERVTGAYSPRPRAWCASSPR